MCSQKKETSKRKKENNKTKIMLTDITRGLYHAGATVNGMLADQYVKLLENFFVYDQSDDSYTAKTMKLNLPDDKVVEVPLISMVSPKGLMIDKMKVNMSVKLAHIAQQQHYKFLNLRKRRSKVACFWLLVLECACSHKNCTLPAFENV